MTDPWYAATQRRRGAPSAGGRREKNALKFVLVTPREGCYSSSSHNDRVVAQFGSALDWGSRGRWFESSPPDQELTRPGSHPWPFSCVATGWTPGFPRTCCGIGGHGSFRGRGVVPLGVVAITAVHQLGVLLAPLRNVGSWQGDCRHDPTFRNTADGWIATTPESLTQGVPELLAGASRTSRGGRGALSPPRPLIARLRPPSGPAASFRPCAR